MIYYLIINLIAIISSIYFPIKKHLIIEYGIW